MRVTTASPSRANASRKPKGWSGPQPKQGWPGPKSRPSSGSMPPASHTWHPGRVSALWALARAQLAADLELLGVRDRRVLEAMRRVPRHLFVPEVAPALAYEDRALPIAAGQTISQPYVVAAMTEAA